jgi:hypothetical protein
MEMGWEWKWRDFLFKNSLPSPLFKVLDFILNIKEGVGGGGRRIVYVYLLNNVVYTTPLELLANICCTFANR